MVSDYKYSFMEIFADNVDSLKRKAKKINRNMLIFQTTSTVYSELCQGFFPSRTTLHMSTPL